jgi:gliding motility-associated protein GldE
LETSTDDPLPGLYSFLGLIFNHDTALYFFSGLTLILLLILSALVSGSEVAYFSFTHNDIENCKKSKTPAVLGIVRLLRNPKQLLATILILNNAVNIAIVTLATFLTWQITGLESAEGKIAVILTMVVTITILLFGEVIPKNYAAQNNLSFARFTSFGLYQAGQFLKPLSLLLLRLSSIVERRVEKQGYDVSMEELGHALELTTDETTSEGEKEILRGIVSFSSLFVKQVMKSRLDITAIDHDTDFHELMDKINKSGYSRIPVYRETVDNIAGILYVKDLLPFIEEDENFKWHTLLRPAFFIPESKKLDSLLRDFQEKRVHMAIVVDEYGGTSGLITLEDVIEEIVGEINDEFDDEESGYNKLDQNTYVFEGKISLNDFAKALDIDLSIFEDIKGESESLAGLILELHTKLPKSGEIIYFQHLQFTIISVDKKKIKKVRVTVQSAPALTSENETS